MYDWDEELKNEVCESQFLVPQASYGSPSGSTGPAVHVPVTSHTDGESGYGSECKAPAKKLLKPLTSNPEDYCTFKPIRTTLHQQRSIRASRPSDKSNSLPTDAYGWEQPALGLTFGSDQSGCSITYQAAGGRAGSRLRPLTAAPSEHSEPRSDGGTIRFGQSNCGITITHQSDYSASQFDHSESSSHEVVWDSLSEGNSSFEMSSPDLAVLEDDTIGLGCGEDSNQPKPTSSCHLGSGPTALTQSTPSMQSVGGGPTSITCLPSLSTGTLPPFVGAPSLDSVPCTSSGLTPPLQLPQSLHTLGSAQLKRSKQAFNSPFTNAGELLVAYCGFAEEDFWGNSEFYMIQNFLVNIPVDFCLCVVLCFEGLAQSHNFSPSWKVVFPQKWVSVLSC